MSHTSHFVLVVDDEPVILNVLRDLVSRAGSSPLLAQTSLEALQLAQNHPLAAVVVDYLMPETPAPDLLRQIATIHPDASRIVMTGMPSL
ncbi:MAG: response regulator, partial [Chthoniobacterales bacterium]|nr:response regulator [Chthoniobacterales bacterium]